MRVTPRAAADRVGPYAEGILQVRVSRPPADGEANEAVRALIGRMLAVPRSAITLVAGERSRSKRFTIDGLSDTDLQLRLSAIRD